MNRWIKIGAIIVVLVLIGTYAIYSLDYKGNYNVSVEVQLTVDQYGVVSLSQFSYECEPTEVFDWWGLAKGHSGAAESGYIVHWTMNMSGESGTSISSAMVDEGTSKTLPFQLMNLAPGVGMLTITVYDAFNTFQHSRTYEVVVG